LQFLQLVTKNLDFALLVLFKPVQVVRCLLNTIFNWHQLLFSLLCCLLWGLLSTRAASCGFVFESLRVLCHSHLQGFDSLSVLRLLTLVGPSWSATTGLLGLGLAHLIVLVWTRDWPLSLRKVGKRLVFQAASVASSHICETHSGARCLLKDLSGCAWLLRHWVEIGSGWRWDSAAGRLERCTLQHL